ncbi:Dolichyl-diphosphooligosaccharide--protein glycosyltransferase subunit WBP1 [Cladochytrium replicatum]|nr:Dolichyl-diphosphooligosaccharide--protein glycosyltransferase subunit WBP1 [Cladochytrium replicatum]
MFTVLFWAAFACAWAAPAAAASAGGQRTLVVLDSLEQKNSLSIFLDGLRARGLDITYGKVDDPKIELFKFGSDRQYDNVVYFASGTEPSSNLAHGKLIEFVNDGGNVLVAASSNVSDAIRDFALEFSADFDESGSAVLDEYNSGPLEGSIISRNVVSRAIVGESVDLVIFRGVGHRITYRNPLMTAILSGSASAYSADRADVLDGSPIVGQQLVLVSAIQARNNARVAFSGSLDLFSNDFINSKVDGKESGNKLFATEIGKWTFQEKNVLKVARVFHHRQNETEQHGIYRIKDDMVYEIDISLYQGDSWVPFVASDMQFEAVMLDPYVRSTLSLVSKSEQSAKYATSFKLPDRHGVFTFRVEYMRHGLTWLTTKDVVEVRPFRHNDYPRYITQAFPYYANSISLIVGFVFVSALWLYHKESSKGKVKTN